MIMVVVVVTVLLLLLIIIQPDQGWATPTRPCL